MSPPPESLLGRHPRPCLCPLLSVYSWNHKAHLLSVHLSGQGRTGWVTYTVPLEPGTAHIIISAERKGEEVSFSSVCRPIRCFASPSSSEVLSVFEPATILHPSLPPTGWPHRYSLTRLSKASSASPPVTQPASWTSAGPPGVHEQTPVAGHPQEGSVRSRLQFSSSKPAVVQHVCV